jgi:hypothetical protein
MPDCRAAASAWRGRSHRYPSRMAVPTCHRCPRSAWCWGGRRTRWACAGFARERAPDGCARASAVAGSPWASWLPVSTKKWPPDLRDQNEKSFTLYSGSRTRPTPPYACSKKRRHSHEEDWQAYGRTRSCVGARCIGGYCGQRVRVERASPRQRLHSIRRSAHRPVDEHPKRLHHQRDGADLPRDGHGRPAT